MDSPVSGANINRPRSTSNVSTSFPSSHDAFGLSASPSATSNMAKAGMPGTVNSNRQTSPWSQSGSNGYGLYGMSTNVPETSANNPSGNQFAHGILPTSTLLGDSQFRMNRPSGLSQAWAGDDMESEDVSTAAGGSHLGVMDSANSDVEQWRSALEPPAHMRRSQSSFASIPDPKSPHLDCQSGYSLGHNNPSSSARFSMALRRVSSEHSAVRDSSEISGVHREPGPDGFDVGGMNHGLQAGHDSFSRVAKTPPKGFRHPLGDKTLIGHRDSIDASTDGDVGSMDRDRGMGSGFAGGSRRRSSMMDTTQPRLLPANLRKTLAAEANLPMQEIRSEALLQRLILSNSESLPMTPRPSRRGRMLNSFQEVDSDDSDPEPGDDNSSDEGPFAVDDLVTGDDMVIGGMDIDMSGHQPSPFTFAHPGGARSSRQAGTSGRGMPGRTSASSAGLGGFGSLSGISAEDRHESRASQGSARGSDVSINLFNIIRLIADLFDLLRPNRQAVVAWKQLEVPRATPPHGGRVPSPAEGPTSEKVFRCRACGRQTFVTDLLSSSPSLAAFDDARFEPYSKRNRPGEHSPSHWTGTLPPGPTPLSPTSHHIPSDPMDFTPHATSRSINFARSRGGSPAATGQMQAMRTVSPVTSSPLANMAAAGSNGGPIGMPPGMAMGYRPTIGMGGLGMLLMSKRNGQGVGTGLMGNDGETAVAEGIGGMDVRSRDQDDDKEDEMVFD